MMHKHLRVATFILLFIIGCSQAATAPPNIVLILSDDRPGGTTVLWGIRISRRRIWINWRGRV